MTIKNTLQFILSVAIIGTGISLITQSGLGTTAVSSLPFVVSELTPLSFGMLTMLFNSLWVFLQLVLLGSRFEKRQVLQFLVGPVLGLAINGSGVLLEALSPNPTHYIGQLLLVLAGVTVLAFGVFLQMNAAVIYNPAEGVVYTLSRLLGRKFGEIKVCFDILIVITAVFLSFVFSGEIIGLREGTLLTALLVGPTMNGFQNLFTKKSPALNKNN